LLNEPNDTKKDVLCEPLGHVKTLNLRPQRVKQYMRGKPHPCGFKKEPYVNRLVPNEVHYMEKKILE